MTQQIIDFIVPVALKDVFDAIAPSFELETGHRFKTTVMLNPEVPGHIARGCNWSIAASNPVYIQSIIDSGASDGILYDLGYSPLSFGRAGDPAMKVLQERDDIATFLQNALSIAITEAGTSGKQFAQLLDELEISEDIAAKVVRLPGGGPMASLLQGKVEVAALPLTNIAPIKDAHAVAICPPDMNVHIDLAFCLHERANPASKAFAEWLIDADLRSYGLLRDVNGR